MKDPERSIVRRVHQPVSTSTPVVPTLSPSVVYRTTDADALDAQYNGRVAGYTYAREGHPNATMLAEKIDWMEGVTGGTVTGSGMAAVACVFAGLLEQGDHIVAGDQLYGRTLRLLNEDLPRLGLCSTLVDPTQATHIEAAIRAETRVLFLEVVSNPTLRIADMHAIQDIAEKHDLLLVVDNTFTTPRAYRPFDHGADIVIHSITKMLGGHSDVTLGYVASHADEINRKLHETAVTWGFTPSPFDCWLAERGLNTFELRFDRAQHNAAELAQHLATLDGVDAVFYPGREDHPDHALAVTLLNGNFANMVSFRLRGERKQINAFAQAAPGIPFAPTLGDVGTTLSHPASSSHRYLTPEQRENLGITEGLIRVSVGVEDIDLLKRELTAAIDAALKT